MPVIGVPRSVGVLVFGCVHARLVLAPHLGLSCVNAKTRCALGFSTRLCHLAPTHRFNAANALRAKRCACGRRCFGTRRLCCCCCRTGSEPLSTQFRRWLESLRWQARRGTGESTANGDATSDAYRAIFAGAQGITPGIPRRSRW